MSKNHTHHKKPRRTRRTSLLYPLSLALAMLTTSAIAKIHPTAFKDVTSHFVLAATDKETGRTTIIANNQMYSPTFGMVALDTGLVENIRLYGNYTAGYAKDGVRQYTKDTSDDPLWNVVNILFPSNNGQLGVQTDSDCNIGRYVSDPKTVALLVNVAKSVYDDKEVDADKTIDTIASTLKDADGKPLAGKIKQNIKKEIKSLLAHIQSAIKAENENTSLYPKGTTVQMIQAFFCYKFTTKEHIKEELDALDDAIVDHKELDTSYLEAKDLKEIINKYRLDVDDFFDLTQGYIFTSPLPYKEGISPLNNGQAKSYDRANKTETTETFADCVEVSIRHLCNLLFFDSKSRAFDVSHIKNDNLKTFYDKQSSLLANNGDLTMRSLWNTGHVLK